jgi:hypothetical protein
MEAAHTDWKAMDNRKILIKMLQQLLKEMELVSSQGAGYYTCVPFARRFNKLMQQTKTLFPELRGLMKTFDDIDGADPKDPAEKSKVLTGIRVETSQLITLLQSSVGDSE